MYDTFDATVSFRAQSGRLMNPAHTLGAIMIRKSIVVLLFLFTSSVYVAAAEMDEDKIALIDQLFEQTGQSGVAAAEQMMALFTQQFSTILKSQNPDIDEQALVIAEQAVIDVTMAEMVNGKALNKIMYPIYSKHFSTTELKQIIAFNSTPTGRKQIQLSPILMQEGMLAGKKLGESLAPKISSEIAARLKEAGY